MDIHAPHKPILTLKEALVHLAIVTIGILIALSLEGARQWFEHRSLGAEARENIRREMEANAKEVEHFLHGLPETQKEFMHARDLVERVQAGTKSLGDEQVTMALSLPSLHTASRTTAEMTGAFAYLPYEDVQRYAGVYDDQAEFVRLQHTTLDALAAAVVRAHVFADPSTATKDDVQELTRNIDMVLGTLFVEQQLGNKLLDSYRKEAAK